MITQKQKEIKMKKVILASTVALSILGFTQATVQAQENKAESVR